MTMSSEQSVGRLDKGGEHLEGVTNLTVVPKVCNTVGKVIIQPK